MSSMRCVEVGVRSPTTGTKKQFVRLLCLLNCLLWSISKLSTQIEIKKADFQKLLKKIPSYAIIGS